METRQKMIEFIKKYFDEHGYAPSIREIGDGVGLSSTSTVKQHMDRLFRDGALETEHPYGSPRAFRLARWL